MSGCIPERVRMKIILNKNNPIPLYYQLETQIKNAIEKKRLLTNQKIPPERSLMRKYNLSYNTVTHALRNLVHQGYLRRIQGKGSFVNDLSVQKRLNKHKFNLIGLTIPHLDSAQIPFVGLIMKGAEEEARNNNFRIVISNDEDDKVLERKHIREFSQNGIDGLIIHYLGEKENIDCLKTLQKENVPFVLVDRYSPFLTTDYVTGDNFLGAYSATKKIIALGYKRILYLSSDENHSTIYDRKNGWEKALKEAGLSSSDNFLGNSHFPDTTESAYQIAKKRLSKEKGTFAIFALNLQVILGIWQAVQDLKIDSRGITFACFDEPPSEIPKDIRLIKVIQPVEEMGREAVKVILKRLKGDKKPYQIVLKPEIVISH